MFLNKKGGLGLKLLVILCSVSVVLIMSGYSSDAVNNIPSYFGFNFDNSTGYLNTSDIEKTNTTIQMGADLSEISGGSLGFFDRWNIISGFVSAFFSFFTAPVDALRLAQAPDSIIFLVGFILVIMWFVALVSFVWRKDL